MLPQSRRAFSVHVAEAAPGYSWTADNWLQPSIELTFERMYDDAIAVWGLAPD